MLHEIPGLLESGRGHFKPHLALAWLWLKSGIPPEAIPCGIGYFVCSVEFASLRFKEKRSNAFGTELCTPAH